MEQIVEEWARRRPAIDARHLRQLPQRVGQTIWRLTNLGWIRQDGHAYSISEAGRRMASLGQSVGPRFLDIDSDL